MKDQAKGKNLIPIPGGKQVRDHHSIPAAPRHNIGNLDRVRNAGYQMKKMEEGLNQFNFNNQVEQFQIGEDSSQNLGEMLTFNHSQQVQMKKNP